MLSWWSKWPLKVVKLMYVLYIWDCRHCVSIVTALIGRCREVATNKCAFQFAFCLSWLFINTWPAIISKLFITCSRLLIEQTHPIRFTRNQKFVNEYFQITFWIQNLTMFPTSDQKSETTFPIAQSLSYNILKFGRKLTVNNRDNGPKPLSCRFMFWKKVTSHRHNTQTWKIMHCRL